MAGKIGVARCWHQAPPRHDSHYDIALSKRALAVQFGAVEITWRQAGAMNMRRRITGSLGKPDEPWVRPVKVKCINDGEPANEARDDL